MEWLFRMGEPALAANLLNPNEAQMSESSYFVWLDANSLVGNWSAIVKSLDDPANPIKEGYLIRLYKASAYFNAGQKEEAETLFLSVYEETSGDRTKLLKSLVFFSTSRQDKLFEKGFKELLSDPIHAANSFRALLPSIYLQRDSVVALKFYEFAAATSPQLATDIALQNDLLYLRILTGQGQNTEKLAELSKANPMDQSLRITHAFAILKSGNPPGALKILEESEQGIAASSLIHHEKAVVAAILAANGQEQEAELVTRMVQPNQLSVQEIQLVQNSFASRKQDLTPTTSAQSPSPKAANKSKR
jgi:hypothetical protein